MAQRGRCRGGRSSSLRRRPAFIDPFRRILVVCEGAETEPRYLNGFKAEHGATTVSVVIASPGGDPLALVESAARLRREAERDARRAGDRFLRYDDVWCVFDVDRHERLDSALRLAKKEAIEVAISNPCFELWLVLHFADHRKHSTAEQIGKALREHLPAYDKHPKFDDFSSGYGGAVTRAETLDRHHAKLEQLGANPSTGVYRLTEHIRSFGKAARLAK